MKKWLAEVVAVVLTALCLLGGTACEPYSVYAAKKQVYAEKWYAESVDATIYWEEDVGAVFLFEGSEHKSVLSDYDYENWQTERAYYCFSVELVSGGYDFKVNRKLFYYTGEGKGFDAWAVSSQEEFLTGVWRLEDGGLFVDVYRDGLYGGEYSGKTLAFTAI